MTQCPHRGVLTLLVALAAGSSSRAGAQVVFPSRTLPAGTFDDVLLMTYIVDQGVVEFTGEGGGWVGWKRMETGGSVTSAMGQGPIPMREETRVAHIECAACPSWVTRDLSSRGARAWTSPSVPTPVSSFGGLKAVDER